MVESAAREVVQRLSAHFKAQMPELELYEEWPNANDRIHMPSISIVSQPAEFMNFPPIEWLAARETANQTTKKGVFKFVIGAYEWKLQLDLWCETKEDRSKFLDLVILAMRNDVVRPGLDLQLENYHNAFANYTLTGFQYGDEEAAAQRTEWRATLEVLASCKAIVTKEEFAILSTDVSSDIEEPSVDVVVSESIIIE